MKIVDRIMLKLYAKKCKNPYECEESSTWHTHHLTKFGKKHYTGRWCDR